MGMVDSESGEGGRSLGRGDEVWVLNEMELGWVIVSVGEGEMRMVDGEGMGVIGGGWWVG